MRATPGTYEGLLEVRLRDIGGGIAKVHIGQRSDFGLVDAQHPRSQAFTGSITTSRSWQRLAAATITGRGRYDVLASINDAGNVLTSPNLVSIDNLPAVTGLPPGSTFSYVITPYDADGNFGPPSRFATVTTPVLNTPAGTEAVPLSYVAYEDLESGDFTALMPGPLGNGVVVSSASAYGGSAYGVRIPAATLVAQAAPDWSSTNTLSWQAQIRPYQDGWGMACRFNHTAQGNNTTTTTTHTEQSSDNTNDTDNVTGHTESNTTSYVLPGTFTDSATDVNDSFTSGVSVSITDSSGNTQNDTPSSSSFSHTVTTGGSSGGTSGTTTSTTTLSGSESVPNVSVTDNIGESDGTHQSTETSITNGNTTSTSGTTGPDTSHTHSIGQTYGTQETTTITAPTDPNAPASDTSTATDGSSSNFSTTIGHQSTTTTNPGSESHGHSHTHSQSESANIGQSISDTGPNTSHSHATAFGTSDNMTTTTTIASNQVQEQFGLFFNGSNVYGAYVDFSTGIIQQLTNSTAVDPSVFHLAELTTQKTQNGVAFRIMLDRHVLVGYEEEGAGLVDYTLSGVDADNIALATSFIGGGLIAGASEDLLDWDPSLNASGYLLSWQQDATPWRSIDLGNVTDYTHNTPNPATSTLRDPPAGPLAVDYARLRISLGAGSTETRLLAQPIAHTAFAGGKDELVHLGRFSFPPGGPTELMAEAFETRVVLEGQVGGTKTAALSVAQLWFMPADEPDSWAGMTATLPGLSGTAVEWRIGTDRWGRSYGRAYDINTGSFLAAADTSGALGCGPGDTVLTVCCESENANGSFSPDLGLTYQVATQRVPRTKWLSAPGAGW